MFLLNSRLGQFCATLQKGHPFSRSYGVRLPSSLTRAHSITLGLSSLPTRVGLRYGHSYFNGNEAFLDGLGLAESPRVSPQLPPTFSYLSGVDLPTPASPMVADAPCPMGTLSLPFRVPPLPP
jgi:hypothetical protein